VRDLLKETVFKGIEKEYSDLSAQMTFVLQEAIGKSSNMAELVGNIQNYDGKLNSVDKTKTALMVRLDPFLRSPLKEIFFCDRSNPDFSRLGECNVVLDLHALDALVAYNDEIRLIYNTVTTYFLRKMLAREPTDYMTNLFVADEAQLLVPKILQKIIIPESWLAHFDVQVTRKLRIANLESTPTLEDERVPQGGEMGEILSRAKLFEGAAISLISKAGLRPETLGNYDGSDGLVVKDLPDVVIQQGVARLLLSPPRIVVRRTLSKAGHQYLTFMSAGGAQRLLAYLNERLSNGEPLNADTPVLAPDYVYKAYRGKNAGKRFLPTQYITNRIRETLRPRFTWRPYVFRAYFDTQLLIAEARGKIAHDFRVFFMGHKGSIEAKYTTNKGVLPDELLKEMRDAFKRSEPFLDLEMTADDPLIKQREQIQSAVSQATPEQLGQMQEMLRNLGVGKIIQAS
jgi:hypothetical protein